MAYANSNAYGAAYLFGFKSTDAPSIAGFFARSAELRFELETFVQLKDAQGITRTVISAKPYATKITATFTGYITSSFNLSTLGGNFQFPPSTGFYYTIRAVSQPKRKGEFNEVTFEAEGYPFVTP